MTSPVNLARADQELARIEHQLAVLRAVWVKSQPEFDAAGLGRLDRLCAYARRDVAAAFDATGLVFALAVTIEKLAAHDG